MAGPGKVSDEGFVAMLERGVREEVRRIIAEEADLAGQRVRERMNGMVDQLAINLLSHYEVYRMQERLIIEVRKPPVDAEPKRG